MARKRYQTDSGQHTCLSLSCSSIPQNLGSFPSPRKPPNIWLVPGSECSQQKLFSLWKGQDRLLRSRMWRQQSLATRFCVSPEKNLLFEIFLMKEILSARLRRHLEASSKSRDIQEWSLEALQNSKSTKKRNHPEEGTSEAKSKVRAADSGNTHKDKFQPQRDHLSTQPQSN